MRRRNRNVILLLDNAPCHPEISLSNVKLLFLPPNTTSHTQPLDQGIIQSFKLQYRKRVLRSLVARMDDAERVTDLTKMLNVGDAVSWTKSAWNEVKLETIQKCFKRCGVLNINCEDVMPQPHSEELEEVETLAKAAGTAFDADAEMEEVPCFDDLEGDWETRLQDDCQG